MLKTILKVIYKFITNFTIIIKLPSVFITSCHVQILIHLKEYNILETTLFDACGYKWSIIGVKLICTFVEVDIKNLCYGDANVEIVNKSCTTWMLSNHMGQVNIQNMIIVLLLSKILWRDQITSYPNLTSNMHI